MRRFLAASAALLLIVLGSQAVLAYYQSSGTLTTSSGNVSPGGQVTVSGSGFASQSSVQITIASTPVLLATVTTDASGAFSTSVTIPSSMSGTHTISATGTDPAGSVRVLSSSITVAAQPDAGTPASMFPGGTDSLVIAIAGAGVVIMTGLLLFVTRARWSRS